MHVERSNLNKLNEEEVKEKYHITVKRKFTAPKKI
jgi:hypothetical protein